MKNISFSLFKGLALSIILLAISNNIGAQYSHQQDIIYGYKDGMALVMDVHSPNANPNGAGIINIISGGMISSPYRSHYEHTDTIIKSLLDSGYVIFSVAHGSQPKYTIEEIRNDISRSIRFVRHNAARFEIDPQKIGIMGKSSGAQLALMAALRPPLPDHDSWDTVDHESSKLQATVAYYPGTDMTNFGQKNTPILEHLRSIDVRIDAAFDFHVWDTMSYRFERIKDPEIIKRIYRENSPITWVSEDDAPVLVFHGDKDKTVPIQQSELLISGLKGAGVKHKFIIAQGKGHGWDEPIENELNEIINWYNLHLLGLNK